MTGAQVCSFVPKVKLRVVVSSLGSRHGVVRASLNK